MAFSFNDSRRNIVWKGFTLKYYEKAEQRRADRGLRQLADHRGPVARF
jgi:ABC-type spermidine/putrescine transport system permease subunit II